MKNSIPFTLYIIFFVCLYNASAIKNIPDMLERATKGVVIVTEPDYGVQETPPPFGIVSSKKSESENNWIFEGSGSSGFVIKKDNKLYVITNVHVIEGYYTKDKTISIYSINGSKYNTKIVGGDDFFDIGVLEFTDVPGEEIEALEFHSDENLRIGEQVFAIGHPMLATGNHQFTVTNGIVSAKNRRMEGTTGRFGMIQHTASLLYGNSGGPLIDEEGRVIGINTSIGREDVGVFNTIGGSVPVNVPVFYMNYSVEYPIIQRVINDVIKYGRIQRSFFGFELLQVYSTFTGESKVIVSGLIDNSIASENFDIDDIVQKINGEKINNIDDALEAFESTKPGNEVQFEVSHRGTNKKVNIVPNVLDEKNLEAIARYCFSRQTNYKIKEQHGKVLLTGIPDNLDFSVYSAGLESYNRKVNILSDLAKIIRNTSMRGILYVFSESDYLEIILGGNVYNIKSILYY
ncbi:S1C family serine protease [Bacteroidota bacterium]